MFCPELCERNLRPRSCISKKFDKIQEIIIFGVLEGE